MRSSGHRFAWFADFPGFDLRVLRTTAARTRSLNAVSLIRSPFLRRAGALPLLLRLDPEAKPPLNQQIYQGLRSAILDGRLRIGTRMQSSRMLATDISISMDTVLPKLQAAELVHWRFDDPLTSLDRTQRKRKVQIAPRSDRTTGPTLCFAPGSIRQVRIRCAS